jgi:hypothetical protein
MSRPRILTEAKKLEICTLVHAGSTLAAAARYVGCSVLTIQREARRNPEFREKLRRKRMSAEMSPIQTLHLAASANWRAAAWLLERTQPQHYAKRTARSFSPAEMAELLDRVCHIIRQEIRDAKQRARIERRVLALCRINVLRKDDAPSNSRLPAPSSTPTSLAQAESATPCGTASEHPASSGVPSETNQNATEKEPVLICLADVPPHNSRQFAPAYASK